MVVVEPTITEPLCLQSVAKRRPEQRRLGDSTAAAGFALNSQLRMRALSAIVRG